MRYISGYKLKQGLQASSTRLHNNLIDLKIRISELYENLPEPAESLYNDIDEFIESNSMQTIELGDEFGEQTPRTMTPTELKELVS